MATVQSLKRGKQNASKLAALWQINLELIEVVEEQQGHLNDSSNKRAVTSNVDSSNSEMETEPKVYHQQEQGVHPKQKARIRTRKPGTTPAQKAL